jgi:hypothetical protein
MHFRGLYRYLLDNLLKKSHLFAPRVVSSRWKKHTCG